MNNVGRGNSDFGYERTEFLGDSVVKVFNSMVMFANTPSVSKRYLTKNSEIAVRNENLADVALQMKVYDYVKFSGIPAKEKSWLWPWGSCEIKMSPVSEKVLAECVEALIVALLTWQICADHFVSRSA